MLMPLDAETETVAVKVADLKVHDMRFQRLPPLSEHEFAALKEDIEENGLLHPPEVDEDGRIIDGFSRVRALTELGYTETPVRMLRGLTDNEKIERALRANALRRHLTTSQRKNLARQLLTEKPAWADRFIARLTQLSHHTVATIRASLEDGGQVGKTPSRQGRDGKTYPSPRKPESETESPAAPPQLGNEVQEANSPTCSPSTFDALVIDSFLADGSLSAAALADALGAVMLPEDAMVLAWVTPSQVGNAVALLAERGLRLLTLCTAPGPVTVSGELIAENCLHLLVAVKGKPNLQRTNTLSLVTDVSSLWEHAMSLMLQLLPDSMLPYLYIHSEGRFEPD